MKTILIASAIALAALTGCAGMNDHDQRVGSGAIIGGVAGSVLTHGSAAGVIGGAVLGGVVGDSVDRDAKQQRRDDWQRRYNECRRYDTVDYCNYNIK
jgi:osmotically inducible lipoprotein OsmB